MGVFAPFGPLFLAHLFHASQHGGPLRAGSRRANPERLMEMDMETTIKVNYLYLLAGCAGFVCFFGFVGLLQLANDGRRRRRWWRPRPSPLWRVRRGDLRAPPSAPIERMGALCADGVGRWLLFCEK